MSNWTKVDQLPELSKQLVFNKFNQTFNECKRFVLVSFEECEWSELDISAAKCEQLINKVKCKLNVEKGFQSFVDKTEIENSFHYVREYFGKIIQEVQQFKLFLKKILTESGLTDSDQNHQGLNVHSGQNHNSSGIVNNPNMEVDIPGGVKQHRCDNNYLDQFQKSVVDLESNTTEFQNSINGIYQVDNLIDQMFSHYTTLLQIIQTLPKLVNNVKDEWKANYKKFLLKYPFKNSLNLIEDYFVRAIQVILENRAFLVNPNGLINYLEIGQVQEITGKIDLMDLILKDLMSQSFIIEDQPCVLHKMNYFNIKCRFLFGPKLLGYRLYANINPIQLKGKNVNIEQNTTTTNLDLISDNQICLNDLKLNGFKRTASGSYVTQQMYQFTFDGVITLSKLCPNFGTPVDSRTGTAFDILNISTTFHEDSLPVSIISHTRQDAGAWGGLWWTYYFDDPFPRVSAQVSQVRKVLNDMFVNRFGTGFGLTDNNLDFLEQKLRGNMSENNRTVPRSNLINVKVVTNGDGKRKKLSFWDFFYHAHKLTSDHFEDLWKDGLIVGFISRPESQRVLSKCPAGTFLLRFSESEQGGIGITYYDQGNLENLEPFKTDSLEKTKLADLLRNCRDKDEPDRDLFTYIYTANGEVKNKQIALAKHYTPIEKRNKDDPYHDGLVQVLIPKTVRKIKEDKEQGQNKKQM